MNHKTANNKVSVPSYFKTNVAESATTVYVYNEYFVNGSDSFANIEMPDQIIEAGKITFDLHDNTQRNISVYLNSSYSGTALITISNVRDNSTYASPLNLGKVTENQVVYFRYQVETTSGGWCPTTTIANYTASATVAQLKAEAGYTLVFRQQ